MGLVWSEWGRKGKSKLREKWSGMNELINVFLAGKTQRGKQLIDHSCCFSSAVRVLKAWQRLSMNFPQGPASPLWASTQKSWKLWFKDIRSPSTFSSITAAKM